MKKKAVSIFTSDIHLSEMAPTCRQKEEDWMKFQSEKLQWLGKLKKKLKCELFIVGDLFDKAKVSNELLNMTIDNLPECYLTIGNHDILYHSMDLLDKSGLGCLTRYDKFTLMNEPVTISNFEFVPFHFGHELRPYEGESTGIALIHEFTWQGEEPYPGASTKGNVKNLVRSLKGFSKIFSGDNHAKFITEVDDVTIVNHGSLMRLTAKQMDYQPSVYVLYNDGSVEAIDVPCENDVISREHLEIKEIKDERIQEFVASLSTVYHKKGESELDFTKNMKEWLTCNEIDDSIIEILENASNTVLK